jgi:hypothetical protein
MWSLRNRTVRLCRRTSSGRAPSGVPAGVLVKPLAPVA